MKGHTSEDDRGRVFANPIPRNGKTLPWQTVRKKDKQHIERHVHITPENAQLSASAMIEWR